MWKSGGIYCMQLSHGIHTIKYEHLNIIVILLHDDLVPTCGTLGISNFAPVLLVYLHLQPY